MRMLLVEDEKKVSDLVARALRAERYAVDVAGDGQSGLDLVALRAAAAQAVGAPGCRHPGGNHRTRPRLRTRGAR